MSDRLRGPRQEENVANNLAHRAERTEDPATREYLREESEDIRQFGIHSHGDNEHKTKGLDPHS